jgi:hypothetical protein
MNGRIGDFEKIGMFLVWEIGADGLKRPHRSLTLATLLVSNEGSGKQVTKA